MVVGSPERDWLQPNPTMSVEALPVVLLRQQFAALEEHLPAALRGAEVGVHQARVASRRLREVLPVMGPPAGERRLERALKQVRALTRVLGPVRELDVSLKLLDELPRLKPIAAAAVPPLRRLVAAERRHCRTVMEEQLDDETAQGVLEAVRSVARRLADRADDDAWRSRIADRVRTRASVLIAVMYDAGALFDSARLHAVRIAAKKLRYAVELAGEARMVSVKPAIKTLKETQERLGRLHDLQVLLVFARAPELAAGPYRNELAAFREHVERECHMEHSRYLKRRSRLIAVADRLADALAADDNGRVLSDGIQP